MNRIILIGNGFDLAHGLNTSYKSFIDSYWQGFMRQAESGNTRSHSDEYMNFSTNYLTLAHVLSSVHKPLSYDELLSQIHSFKTYQGLGRDAKINLTFTNQFMERILKKSGLQKWVDIENEYYENIKEISRSQSLPSLDEYNISSLNHEFKMIEILLENYLTEVENGYTTNISIVNEINKKILSPFNIEDISHKHINTFLDEIKHKIEELSSMADITHILNSYQRKYPMIDFDLRDVTDFIEDCNKSDSKENYIAKQISRKSIAKNFIVPDDILFLNFNYTHTTDIYNNRSYFKTIHIHGELNNAQNSIIFGYGDELADSYKTIENLNDNNYLVNVKSIRYLETSNYRELINFMELKPYQIFIMGHSCGNSDRTLLNTLFEHDNCISIKPYYYQRAEDEDNYNDIVQNISRNFRNKPLMRDRVVNKTYCEPLLDLI